MLRGCLLTFEESFALIAGFFEQGFDEEPVFTNT
jgi:hypothetical protein